jgi:hypothetical protein
MLASAFAGGGELSIPHVHCLFVAISGKFEGRLLRSVSAFMRRQEAPTSWAGLAVPCSKPGDDHLKRGAFKTIALAVTTGRARDRCISPKSVQRFWGNDIRKT